MSTKRLRTALASAALAIALANCSDDLLSPEDMDWICCSDTRVVAVSTELSPVFADEVRFEVDPPLIVTDVDPLEMSPFIRVPHDRLYRLASGGKLRSESASGFAPGDSVRVWYEHDNTRSMGDTRVAALALIR